MSFCGAQKVVLISAFCFIIQHTSADFKRRSESVFIFPRRLHSTLSEMQLLFLYLRIQQADQAAQTLVLGQAQLRIFLCDLLCQLLGLL